MLFSNKITLLSLFGAFAICANLANATETVTFHFYYESGINDVNYAYNGQYDGSSMPTLQVNKSDEQTTVNVTAKMDGEKSTANSFIDNLQSSTHMVGLHTTDSEPNQLDFWIDGELSINGERVSSNFYIARIPDHYWLGATEGKTYTGSDGNNSPTNRGLQMYGLTTKQPYCLMGHGTEYYAVYVYPGTCDNALNQETETQEFVFQWLNGVESLSFEPFESSGYESGQIASITSTSYGNSQTIIKITAAPLGSSSVAASFNSLMRQNKNCGRSKGSKNVYDFELHAQGLVCGPSPQYLDFYISGYLLINGYYVVSYNTDIGQNRVFVLAYGEGRWWLGTVGSPFDRYGSGGFTYVNWITSYIKINENSYLMYKLNASSDNKFKVYQTYKPD